MKTILSLTTLATVATLLGLLPWAQGESKEPGKRTGALPVPGEKAVLPTVEPSKSTASVQTKTTRKAKAAPSNQVSKEAPLVSSTKSSEKKLPAEVAKLPLTESQEGKLLVLLNEGTVEDLDAIPGIAATRADSIVSARPYGSVHEIILVEGVGNATFEKILAYGKTLTQRSGTTTAGTRKS